MMKKRIMSLILTLAMLFSFGFLQSAIAATATSGAKVYTPNVYIKNVSTGQYLTFSSSGEGASLALTSSKSSATVFNIMSDYADTFGLREAGGLRRYATMDPGNGRVWGYSTLRWSQEGDKQLSIDYMGSGTYQFSPSTSGYSSNKLTIINGTVYISTYSSSNSIWQYEEAGTPLQPISSGVYYIKNEGTGHMLTLDGSAPYNGLNVSAKAFTGSSLQKWRVTKLNWGYYVIKPYIDSTSSYALDVRSNYDDDLANIDIWNIGTGSAVPTYAQWKITPVYTDADGGYSTSFRIASACSYFYRVLFVSDTDKNVYQYAYTPSARDQLDEWSFQQTS